MERLKKNLSGILVAAVFIFCSVAFSQTSKTPVPGKSKTATKPGVRSTASSKPLTLSNTALKSKSPKGKLAVTAKGSAKTTPDSGSSQNGVVSKGTNTEAMASTTASTSPPTASESVGSPSAPVNGSALAGATGMENIKPDVNPAVLPPGQRSDSLPPEMKKIRDSILVKWFQPQGVPSEDKKSVRITLAGQTKQRTRIYLKSNKILYLKKPTDRTMMELKSSDVKYLPSLADQRGIFGFEVNLPLGNYQIAVAAVDPDAQSMSAAKVFVLFLNVKLKNIEFGFIEEDDDLPFVPQSDYYAIGGGINYSVFNKAVPSIPSEIRFSSFKIPSLRLGYAKTYNPEWRIHGSFLIAPGEATSGTRVPVDGGSYLWLILNGDGIYSRDPWKKEWGDYKIRYGLRGGLQYHVVPFIRSKWAADNTQNFLGVNYMAPTIGGHIDVMTGGVLSYEAYIKMNVPFIAYSSIKMSNSLAFDGSLGIRYRKKKEPWSYGLYWYGQWLRLSFKERDVFAGSNVSGTLDILQSNAEFRMMYQY